MKLRLALVIVLISSICTTGALACGDSLYHVGKGVAYRVYTAPLPGSVLVYGQTDGAKKLAEALAQSGHGVRLVDNQIDLSMELQSGNYDVIIAPYNEHDTVESSGGGAGEATDFLPVAMSQDEEKAAEQAYSKVMLAERDQIKHYLKAIHKSLKSKT